MISKLKEGLQGMQTSVCSFEWFVAVTQIDVYDRGTNWAAVATESPLGYRLGVASVLVPLLGA